MSFHLERRTLYTLLRDYMAHYGQLINNDEQLRVALTNTEELIDFALYKADIAIDVDAAKRVSLVGLAWLDYVKHHPDNPEGYAPTAKAELESTVMP
ncbi:hypothetical protein [Oceanisphaera sp. IT1-181]|uniref:hypothetical protein n=1 Tax=Oceanisphaera sp. IT1-181 TaxID=3081199 RepID=UPI0029C9FE07|nr:hypothetical protein [Oceanisphaera sp. IT1-181]